MAELNIEPYDEDEGTGELRYVQVMYLMEMYNPCLLFTLHLPRIGSGFPPQQLSMDGTDIFFLVD